MLDLPWTFKQHDAVMVGRYDLYYIVNAAGNQVMNGLSREYAEAVVKAVNANAVTPLDKLRQAVRLIDEVGETLNTQHHNCECCGLTVYKEPREWQQKQMLTAASSRVEKVAGEMRRRDEKQ